MKYRLGDICKIEKGKTGITKAVPGAYPLVTTAAKRKQHNEFQFDTKAVLIPLVSSTGHGHASLNRIHYQEGKFALGTILCAVIPRNEEQLNAKFLHVYLQRYKDLLLVPLMKGAANVSLSVNKIASLEIEVPPFDRQIQIVDQEERLSMELNQLEVLLAKQEEDVRKLRQSLLRDAMQGKLNTQQTNDETVVELLERIKAKKEQLQKEGSLKKQKSLPPIHEEEIPFDIPKSWKWKRVDDIFLQIVDCPHSTPKFEDSSTGFYCIDTTCINERGEITTLRNVDQATYIDRNKRLVPSKGDIVFSREGTIGLAAIVNGSEPLCLGQRVMLLSNGQLFSSEFFRYILSSEFYKRKLTEKQRGAGAKHVNVKDIKNIVVPFPPLPEQERIVSKLDYLFEYCEALERSIRSSREGAYQLLQATLKEALTVKMFDAHQLL